MLKKMFISLTLMSSFSLFADSYIAVFQKEINDVCPKASSILIKKSVLDILKNPGDKSCSGPFLSSLVNQCNSMDCQGVMKLFSYARGATSGNVVGR